MDDARHPVLAAGYDLALRPLEALGMRDQRRRVGAEARGIVLEIAAGTGLMFPHYGTDVERVVATELDPHMLRRARDRAAEAAVPIELQIADAQALPFADRSFDTVVVALSLCTIPRPDAALGEARRVLRDDGTLLFVEHVRAERDWLAAVQRWATPAWRRVAGGCHLDRETVTAIRSAGFELEHLWRSGGGRGVMVQGRATPGRGG